MDKIKIDRQSLLDKLISNREQHIVEFDEAWALYQEEYIKEITKEKQKIIERYDKALKDARKGEQTIPTCLPVPQSHEEDYEDIIEMVKASVDENLELDRSECRKYLLDKWDWKSSFSQTTSSYSSSTSSTRK